MCTENLLHAQAAMHTTAVFNRFTFWEMQFCNKSCDEDDEEKHHILDEI